MASVNETGGAAGSNDGSSTANNIDPNDPLGYDVYAKTLWDRVEHALNRDPNHGKLGDDPLVVGLFGEWGVGKSYLLDKIQARATTRQKELAAGRRGDGGFELLIPVAFQPWKYEHEEHLHVPILLHVLAALEAGIAEAQTIWEKIADKAQKPGDAVVQALPTLVGWVKKAVVGAAVVLDPTSGAALATAQALADRTAADATKRKTSKKPLVASTLKYTSDGRYYYEIHKILKAVCRPGKYPDLQGHKLLNEVFRVNFVIFVDDLDRCLPEKAVAVLELIKTIFNVESFAFVLALDDEVIERGIGHRYSAYLLKDKKPQMPITGFEYLEKIVHLPFRLPALTRAQAAAFVQITEERVESTAALHWFKQASVVSAIVPSRAAVGGMRNSGEIAVTESEEDGLRSRDQGTDRDASLLPILLSCFDAQVPRKLLRAVELWHQISRVARERGIASKTVTETRWERVHEGAKVSLDTRVVFALSLLQLFQPELFRFMRRRVEAFPVLLRAMAARSAVDKGLGKVECSDVELWSWASFREGEKDEKNIKRPQTEAAAVALIAALPSEDAYQAQYIRLRLAERLVEHFSVQRHVFNPLRLMHWLASELEGSSVREFRNLPAYFGVLAQESDLDVVAERLTDLWSEKELAQHTYVEKATVSSRVRSTLTPARFSAGDVDGLFDVLVATDTAARGGIAPRFALPRQQWFDSASIVALTAKFAQHFVTETGAPLSSESMEHALGALGAIVPWLPWQNGAERIVAKLAGVDADANGLTALIASDIPPKTRVALGDLLERFRFGDPRFDGEKPHQWGRRLYGENVEPIPGFVGVPAGSFTMGDERESDNKSHEVKIDSPFYVARTLTTVAQYAKFVEAKGYEAGADIWSAQGLQWRSGSFDSRVDNKAYGDWLSLRTPELRREPWEWAAQREHPSRPVTGVTWFEARAYARWLNEQMRTEINALPALRKYAVMLPTEDQWERAARAMDLTSADARRWPWVGENEKDVPQRANFDGSGISSVSPVGVFAPNPIGLFDMAGNAWEWQDNLYTNATKASYPRVAATQALKTHKGFANSDRPALRGGSWVLPPERANCSSRDWDLPDNWDHNVGFRVVLSLASSSEA